MPNLLEQMHKIIYRRIRYTLTRPKPPKTSVPFAGPVVVVGSAPVSYKPVGFDETYRIISVNASQIAVHAWGIDSPDVTLMGFNELQGGNTAAVETRRVLTGHRTGALYVLTWRRGQKRQGRVENNLDAFNYSYRNLHLVGRYQRIALMHKTTGLVNLELEAETKCSNGMIAVLFALYNGASAVIITGINPHSNGHLYNSANLTRKHTRFDRDILMRLLRQGYPIYTADPHVSEEVGLPLWQGDKKPKSKAAQQATDNSQQRSSPACQSR
ncbi:hypothetical protein ABID08_003603 [Rhizobium binae]|uniref:Membrane-anchored protein n=1 Tax=Rhizobium binae TaxID=1138190 RepID=A0ABV2MIE4_9HYPH|nr:membrane-anchored protein [Rhizobium binae]MBX4994118.1 membrane-anchored protein [Rhizobium binae]NKL50177.1 membrane-anchored protein [Rhizobium leguminosarum bv. viciae]QSY83019.1 membrane-anchored protein [Rhizobium binae]